MTMNNPLGRGAITRIHAPLNPKLHKIRVSVSPNRELILIQITRSFCQPSPDSENTKCRLADDFKGMLIS
jgi:hypothetical protein